MYENMTYRVPGTRILHQELESTYISTHVFRTASAESIEVLTAEKLRLLAV